MESLLSSGKISPENLDIKGSKEDSEENYKLPHLIKRSPSPSNGKIEDDDDRLSPMSPASIPMERNDLFLRFNSCLRGRICSNCGRLDCNFLHCRLSEGIKDSKPVLKFSVSAILGDEKLQQKNSNSGK
ncbi:hypothetical protein JTB14_002959 [Gonioctena quinquepunctata]|nr:hypothetical protein JTB14_002959 [Gonioctena quinquepunctata]